MTESSSLPIFKGVSVMARKLQIEVAEYIEFIIARRDLMEVSGFKIHESGLL